MLGLGGLLGHQKDHKAGWDEGHGHDDEDGDDHIRALQQVIQGEAGARLVHGVVGDSDAVGRGVALALGQVGPQDSVIEAVEVGGHAVVTLVVVENLGCPAHCDLPHHDWGPGTERRRDGLLHVAKGDGPVPVQPEAVGGEEQVLGDIVAGDVGQDVSGDHPHLGRMPTHTTGAGEASALCRTGAADRLPHQAW